MNPYWRVELFAGLRAIHDNRVVTRFRTRKTGLLLAYLAFDQEREHRRESLIELLWPESPPALSRNSLSKELSALRALLEPSAVLHAGSMAPGGVLITDRQTVQLNPAAVAVDVREFEAALDATARSRTDGERGQHLADAVDLYRGELLPGYYEGWVLQERQRLAEAYFQAVRQLIACLERAGDVAGALRLAHQAVRADAFREEICHDLMRLLAALGRPDAALRHYGALARRLEEELGAAPDGQTQALAESLTKHLVFPPTPSDEPLTDAETVANRAASPSPPPLGAGSALPTGTVVLLLAEPVNDAAAAVAGAPLAGALLRNSTPSRPATSRCWREMIGPLLAGGGGQVLPSGAATLQVAFGRASEALAAALAARRLLREHGVERQVRLALLAGEVASGESIHECPVLAHAARLLLAGHGGQLLLSEGTVALLPPDPASPTLQDLGLYCLGHSQPPERLFEARDSDDYSPPFPPPRAVPASPGNLPISATRFFGRDREIARLHELLERPDTRLLSLTGPGGSGKTRLALEAVRSMDVGGWSARWHVALVDLIDPRRIPERVLNALGVPPSRVIEPLDQLVAALGSSAATGTRRPLLLLDNFEHLLPAGAEIVQTLLEQLPSLTCLVTSRHPLLLEGERELVLRPLPTPAEQAPVRDLASCAGVQLFVDRAQTVRPDFHLTEANADAVAAVCRRLEGIPLAIELAAARAQILTPGQMLAQIEHRFELLVSRRRGVHWRHRSLRATLDWSFHLLSVSLQESFPRLSVFRGGWNLEAVERICDLLPMIDALQQFRECSLVEVEESGGEMRFRMLESVREHARDRLSEEQGAALQRRHAEYYLCLAESAEEGVKGRDQSEWLDRLEREHDNMRAALRWSLSEKGDREIGLRLAGALYIFWQWRGHWSESAAWLKGALASEGGPHHTLPYAKVLCSAANQDWLEGRHDQAQSRARQCLKIAEERGDRRWQAYSLMALGSSLDAQGDYHGACYLWEQCLPLFREVADQWATALTLDLLANACSCLGKEETAQTFWAESVGLFTKLGWRQALTWHLDRLAKEALQRGDAATARAYYEESLAMRRALRDKPQMMRSLLRLGNLATTIGDEAAARGCYEESRAIQRELGTDQS